MKIALWIIGSILAVLAAMAIYGNTNEGAMQRAKEREAIDNCRDKQGDELSPVSQRRVIRDACDHLEAEYRKKWGRNP